MKRVTEFIVLFVLTPALVAAAPERLPGLPVLWLATLYCIWILRRDTDFRRKGLWSFSALRSVLPGMLALFSLAALSGYVTVRALHPAQLFELPSSSLTAWALLLVLYAVLSVVPQTIVFRVFFFHRYRPLFRSEESLLLASAAAFAFVHIVFWNPIAIAATLPAGVLFGRRYLRTGSAGVSALEHALHGCMLFTVGLGRYFGQNSSV